jgi:glycerol-3-phosphate dehydrogenase (NAD(P)+)
VEGENNMIGKVSVIGAGSLGTAIAQLVSNNVEEVFLHARRKEVVQDIQKNHRNLQYFPNIPLSPKIRAKHGYESSIDSEIIFFCVPSSAVRKVACEVKDLIKPETVLVSTAKGIEYPSGKTMSQIIYDETRKQPVILSGPNFASEIVLNQPTVTTIASTTQKNLEKVKKVLTTPEFLVDTVSDVVGTEMCSILKNINAIAYGICEGMNLNENARFAVLNKSFQETKEIVKGLGGNPDTVDGYCGLGDMVLTSTSNQSRNHTLGILYGQRITVDEKSSSILFEGKKSVMAIKKLCQENNITCDICQFADAVLNHQKSPEIAFQELWGKMI